MILDVSHLNERSFWDVVDLTAAPLLASHSNAKALASAARNLTDAQMQEIRNTNGLIGLNSFRLFVHSEREKQTIDELIRHADYIADKIGVEHLAFGLDFCEFFEPQAVVSMGEEEELYTVGLEDCTGVPLLLERMKAAGFTEREMQKICYENWWNIIRRVIG